MSVPAPELPPASDRLLILETSGRTGSVAVAARGKVVDVCQLEEARRHARDLAAVVGELLSRQGWRPRDVGGVVVSLGPGSYTGLRVGVTSAKAFAYAAGSRLIGVETFRAIALQAPAEAQTVDVLADAQQGDVYRQRFARTPAGDWQPAGPLEIVRVDEWAAGHGPDVWVSGPGVSAYRDRPPPGALLVPEADRTPRVESLLAVALTMPPGGPEEVWRAEPIYARGSSAEEKVKRQARGGA